MAIVASETLPEETPKPQKAKATASRKSQEEQEMLVAPTPKEPGESKRLATNSQNMNTISPESFTSEPIAPENITSTRISNLPETEEMSADDTAELSPERIRAQPKSPTNISTQPNPLKRPLAVEAVPAAKTYPEKKRMPPQKAATVTVKGRPNY